MRGRSLLKKSATGKPLASPAGQAEARRRSFLDPIITMNAGGVIQSASDTVEQVFGWTPTELFGKNIKELVPEPRRSALDRYLDRYRNTEGPTTLNRTRRFDAIHKDGAAIQIELSMSRADLPAQAASYFIGIVRDVTRQMDVANETTDHRTYIQKLVTEQTRALATANLRLLLADRLATIGTLAAGLGHDMNNVLLPVRAQLNAIEHAGITPLMLARVKAVRQSIAYLQQLSDGLHFLSLDPDGPGATSDGQGVTDLAYWWHQVGLLLRKAIPKHVKLTSSFPASLPHVTIASHWLTQAMLNMIVNAGEAIPADRRGKVRVWAERSDDDRMVKICVSDNGRGMSRAVQHRAFDLFYTTKPRSMGTGLGLPLAHKIAMRAGGDVEIKSELGRGTTVTLTLPVSKVEANDRAGGANNSAAGALLAVVSVGDHRISSLIAQILIAAGVHIKPGQSDGPGKSTLWVTDPSLIALDRAQRWSKQGSKGSEKRTVVLLGGPPKNSRKRWDAIGAKIIDPPDDFATIRHILTEVTQKNGNHTNGEAMK